MARPDVPPLKGSLSKTKSQMVIAALSPGGKIGPSHITFALKSV
jgi:hypothetical protein